MNNHSGIESDPDQHLHARIGGGSWPKFVIMDASGSLLAVHRGRQRTVEAFKALLKAAAKNQQRLTALKAAADAGDMRASGDLLELRIELAHLTPDAARKRLAAIGGLGAERRKQLARAITKAEVEAIQVTATYEVATQVAAGRRFAEMIAKGHIPEQRDGFYFWYFTAVYAEKEKDAALLEKAIAGLKPHAAKVGGALEKWTTLLERWRKEARGGETGLPGVLQLAARLLLQQ